MGVPYTSPFGVRMAPSPFEVDTRHPGITAAFGTAHPRWALWPLKDGTLDVETKDRAQRTPKVMRPRDEIHAATGAVSPASPADPTFRWIWGLDHGEGLVPGTADSRPKSNGGNCRDCRVHVSCLPVSPQLRRNSRSWAGEFGARCIPGWAQQVSHHMLNGTNGSSQLL